MDNFISEREPDWSFLLGQLGQMDPIEQVYIIGSEIHIKQKSGTIVKEYNEITTD